MNISSSITTGGTAQDLVVFNPQSTPGGFYVQNLDASTPLYIRLDGQAANAGQGSIKLDPGDLYETPHFWPIGRPAPKVSIYSSKTGHAFTGEAY